MPVLASVKRRASGMGFDYAKHNFKPNVLRYYGDASDIGFVATYEANKNNKFENAFKPIYRRSCTGY